MYVFRRLFTECYTPVFVMRNTINGTPTDWTSARHEEKIGGSLDKIGLSVD